VAEEKGLKKKETMSNQIKEKAFTYA